MRFCLTCRYFSGDGPICTHCGRSFGGRLCNHKKRHLNPPDAQFCGHCGSTTLTEATTSIPLGCSSRMVLLGGVAALLWWGSGHFLQWGGLSFTAMTGYKSPLVWAIEKCANVLIILFVFYFLSMFMPGPAGEQFRGLISKVCLQSLNFVFKILGGLGKGIGKVLLHLLGGEKTKH
jgi:hypothetical protein